jgi:DNA-binding beta-propeller fold protein YncE
MLLPDNKKNAAINVAGDNVIAVIDVASGQIIRKVPTGKFPCDLHFTPDGRFAYTPERDQDTVSMFDTRTWELVKTVTFPPGSQPHMLRVSPDGKEVWVQTAKAETNMVLNAADLVTLATMPTGKVPITNAWTPDARYSVVTNQSDTFASVFDAKTYKEVARLAVGQGGSNIGFTRDGATGFVAVTGANAVAVLDMAKLSVVSQLKAGTQPQGLIIL